MGVATKGQEEESGGDGTALCLDCDHASIPALCGTVVWQDVTLGEIGNGYMESL